jgi:hypothetical protein
MNYVLMSHVKLYDQKVVYDSYRVNLIYDSYIVNLPYLRTRPYFFNSNFFKL